MVNIKVTFGGETRRFIASGELHYDELVKKVSNLFPSLRESSLKLELAYRDEDGDLVTVSSDEEVVAALSTITAEKTWRLQARQIRPAVAKTSLDPFLFPLLSASRLSPGSALHRLLDPFSLDSHDILLHEGLSLFEKVRLAEKRASEEHKSSQHKQPQKEEEINTSSKDKAKPAEKSTPEKPSSSPTQHSSSSSCHVSWSPLVTGKCPLWTGGLLGPFGYEIHLSWSPVTDQKKESQNHHTSEQPGNDKGQPEPAKETSKEPPTTNPDQPLEEPREKEEEVQSGETTASESVSA